MKTRWKLVFQIFLSFLKIGPVTFGGGYAMIPVIEREVVIKRKWVKVHEIADVFALAESVPGAIAINSATFIGYRIAGVGGAIAALIGVLLPTFLIVVLLSMSFLYFQENPKVEAAFEGIRVSIVALIVYAGYQIGKTAVIDKTTSIMVVTTVLVLFFVHIHPVLLILAGAMAGVVIVKAKERMGLATSLKKKEKIQQHHVK